MVESSALLKRRSPKGYRGFESLPHRFSRRNLRERPVVFNRAIEVLSFQCENWR